MALPARSRLFEWLRNPFTGRWLPLPPRTPAERIRTVLLSRQARAALLSLAILVALIALTAGRNALAAVLFVAWPLAYAARLVRMRRLARRANDALAIVAAGDLVRGAELLRPVARAPGCEGAPSYALAGVLLQLGEHDEAVSTLARVWRRDERLRRDAAAFLGLAYGLGGALDEADAWIAEARRRAKSPSREDGVPLLAEAVVTLRRGDACGAAALLEQRWSDIEQTFVARFYRGVRVLRAFALETASGAPSPASAEFLAGVRPFVRGEFAWLATGWPEMNAYLSERGLAA